MQMMKAADGDWPVKPALPFIPGTVLDRMRQGQIEGRVDMRMTDEA